MATIIRKEGLCFHSVTVNNVLAASYLTENIIWYE